MATSITEAQVRQYLGLDVLDADDAALMTDVVRAVNVLVPATVPRVRALAAGTDWPDDVLLGAKMQAGKLFTRRRSINGVSGYTEMGGPVYVARWDPDLEKLLQIGQWQKPSFG